MGKIVILHNRDYRGVHSVPVIGRSGKKYGSAHLVQGRKLVEHRMAFEDWQKSCWDIAQGGRRAGYTFYVADIINDGDSPALEPKPIISELKAETAEVQPDPFDGIPDFSDPLTVILDSGATGTSLMPEVNENADPPPTEPYPEPALPPSGEPSGAKEARTGELEGLSFRSLRSIAKSSGLDTESLNKSAQLIEAILSIEFP
jgi:hypothetical protein